MEMKPFYELSVTELLNTNATLIELQLQEGQISWMMVSEHIKSSAHVIASLQMQLEHREHEEHRKNEWWKTFRAALGGLASSDKLELSSMHEFAGKLADMTHGPLEKTATE